MIGEKEMADVGSGIDVSSSKFKIPVFYLGDSKEKRRLKRVDKANEISTQQVVQDVEKIVSYALAHPEEVTLPDLLMLKEVYEKREKNKALASFNTVFPLSKLKRLEREIQKKANDLESLLEISPSFQKLTDEQRKQAVTFIQHRFRSNPEEVKRLVQELQKGHEVEVLQYVFECQRVSDVFRHAVEEVKAGVPEISTDKDVSAIRRRRAELERELAKLSPSSDTLDVTFEKQKLKEQIHYYTWIETTKEFECKPTKELPADLKGWKELPNLPELAGIPHVVLEKDGKRSIAIENKEGLPDFYQYQFENGKIVPENNESRIFLAAKLYAVGELQVLSSIFVLSFMQSDTSEPSEQDRKLLRSILESSTNNSSDVWVPLRAAALLVEWKQNVENEQIETLLKTYKEGFSSVALTHDELRRLGVPEGEKIEEIHPPVFLAKGGVKEAFYDFLRYVRSVLSKILNRGEVKEFAAHFASSSSKEARTEYDRYIDAFKELSCQEKSEAKDRTFIGIVKAINKRDVVQLRKKVQERLKKAEVERTN
jgi:hypothetical protein